MSDDHSTGHEPKGKWAEKLAEKRERYESRGRVYRILFLTTGAIVTLGGIAMLVLPGPALVVIPIGLAMLSMQFAWAENALEKALEQAEKASTQAKDLSKGQKIATGLATAAGIAAVTAWAIIGDIPLVPYL